MTTWAILISVGLFLGTAAMLAMTDDLADWAADDEIGNLK
jgi:hypothetical protein